MWGQRHRLEPAPRALKEAAGGPRAKPLGYKSLLPPARDAQPRRINSQPKPSASCPAEQAAPCTTGHVGSRTQAMRILPPQCAWHRAQAARHELRILLFQHLYKLTADFGPVAPCLKRATMPGTTAPHEPGAGLIPAWA